MFKCLQLADFDEVTAMCAAAKHNVANDRQGRRDPMNFFMELVNLSDVSKPVMNRDNDIGESVIQVGVVKVYYASPAVDRYTGPAPCGSGTRKRQVPSRSIFRSAPPGCQKNERSALPGATLPPSLAVRGPGEATGILILSSVLISLRPGRLILKHVL